jgi:hypothetical protein
MNAIFSNGFREALLFQASTENEIFGVISGCKSPKFSRNSLLFQPNLKCSGTFLTVQQWKSDDKVTDRFVQFCNSGIIWRIGQMGYLLNKNLILL